ncbi:hypothetical protein FOA52_002035 [Chlamydomonas sp. UWO 241]|nr:hypothetical protein FOA52_002035 [Chlamydomonas sp. UWO 241]
MEGLCEGVVGAIGWVAQAWIIGCVLGALALLWLVRDVYTTLSIPSISVPLTAAEASDTLNGAAYDPSKPVDKDLVPCYDPATMQLLGHVPAMSETEVRAIIKKAKAAQAVWKSSPFSQRRKLLRILLKFVVENQEEICRVTARDTGKVMTEGLLGEIITTCEKIHWLVDHAEKYLQPEHRSPGLLAFFKAPRVEYVPVGVVGAIVPWNWPFHNLLNPVTAAVFTGNAIVIKVSEHASWAAQYHGRVLKAALAAAGAPEDLVQIVTGFGEAGNAIVTGGADKVIFVGSTQIGKKVMAAAAATLTPVVLELGGKDPFIVLDDADVKPVIQVAIKAAFLNSGQNCAGGERFFVHNKVLDQFVEGVVSVVKQMRQGPPLGHGDMDTGSMTMPGLPQKVQGLVDDAVAKGAKLLAGGKLPASTLAGTGNFYPPTVLLGIKRGMLIWEEEVFGPVMSIIGFDTDDEVVVAMANDCEFGLGSNVFGGQARARRMCERLEAGMSTINDFATTYMAQSLPSGGVKTSGYMAQSLPFGGVKSSGFDRFAGIEGLRGLCHAKAVSEDAVPWLMRSSIPPPWQVGQEQGLGA